MGKWNLRHYRKSLSPTWHSQNGVQTVLFWKLSLPPRIDFLTLFYSSYTFDLNSDKTKFTTWIYIEISQKNWLKTLHNWRFFNRVRPIPGKLWDRYERRLSATSPPSPCEYCTHLDVVYIGIGLVQLLRGSATRTTQCVIR